MRGAQSVEYASGQGSRGRRIGFHCCGTAGSGLSSEKQLPNVARGPCSWHATLPCFLQVVEEGYAFSPGATYVMPGCETVKDVRLCSAPSLATAGRVGCYGCMALAARTCSGDWLSV